MANGKTLHKLKYNGDEQILNIIYILIYFYINTELICKIIGMY